MSEYRIVQEYRHSPAKVWRALTDPALVPLWTATGQGARPVGFSTQVGTKFQFVGKPTVGWNGIVDCEMLEVREQSLLRYGWGFRPSSTKSTKTASFVLGAHSRRSLEHEDRTH